ncbi:hypothetical protein ACQ4PT_007230 [Festuca glaucescens]
MESAGPSAKREQLAAPAIHGNAPLPVVPTAEAIDLEPAVAERSEEPSPGAEQDEEESLDHISRLPDHVLGEVISLLTIMEGSRTQILASRWRHLWRAAPLNLDFCGLPASNNMLPSRCALVSAIIAAHQGSGRRLCLPARHLQCRADAVDAWLRSHALDNLQELEFYFCCAKHCDPELVIEALLPPPASIFRFSSTLRAATISNCYLVDDMVETLRFPHLRKLALMCVKISEVSLHNIISGCPGLECLLLSTISSIRCHRINSTTLRSIGIRSSSEQLIIEDAPMLERLLYLEMNMQMQILVISAPKLETLGCIPEKYTDSKIVFGSTVIQGLRIDSLATVVRTVKILSIHMLFFDQDMVIDLMRCFPCLEKLYAKEKSWPWDGNPWHRKNWDLLTSLDFRLKTIVLRCYHGTRLQAHFATFFVQNARMLESMILEVESCDYNGDFFEKQHEMLQMENRASRGARLSFTTGCHHDVSGIMHVDDLDLADPFACRKVNQGEKNLWRRKHLNFLRSHEIRLKTIVMRYCRGIWAQVNFASFFVLNARVLESIRLEVAPCNYDEGFFEEQHRMLQMEKRASRGKKNVEGIHDVSDLDLAHPFACGC